MFFSSALFETFRKPHWHSLIFFFPVWKWWFNTSYYWFLLLIIFSSFFYLILKPHILETKCRLYFKFLTFPGSGLACNGDILKIECGVGQKIHIHYANYGRLSTTVCPSSAMYNTDCKSPNSLEEVQKRCQGIQSCNVTTNIYEDPYPSTDKYLEVNYFCN